MSDLRRLLLRTRMQQARDHYARSGANPAAWVTTGKNPVPMPYNPAEQELYPEIPQEQSDDADLVTAQLFNGRFEVRVHTRHAVSDLSQRFFDRELLPEEWGWLIGLPDGGVMDVLVEHGEIRLSAVHHLFEGIQERRLFVKGDVLVLGNRNFLLRSEAPRDLGLRVLAVEIAKAKALGIGAIQTFAAGEPGGGDAYQGYWTWPMLGFNADLPDDFRGSLPTPLHAALDGIPLLNLQHVYLFGLDPLWRDYGLPLDVSFSLEQESLSLKLLADYLDGKHIGVGLYPWKVKRGLPQMWTPDAQQVVGDFRRQVHPMPADESVAFSPEDLDLVGRCWQARAADEIKLHVLGSEPGRPTYLYSSDDDVRVDADDPRERLREAVRTRRAADPDVHFVTDKATGKVIPIEGKAGAKPAAVSPPKAALRKVASGVGEKKKRRDPLPGKFRNHREAEEWKARHFPQIALGIDNMPIPVANALLGQFAHLAEHFPEVAKGIRYIGQGLPGAKLGARKLYDSDESGRLFFLKGDAPVPDKPVLDALVGRMADTGKMGRTCRSTESLMTQAFGEQVLDWLVAGQNGAAFTPVVGNDGFGTISGTVKRFLALTPADKALVGDPEDPVSAFTAGFAALYHSSEGEPEHTYTSRLKALLHAATDSARRRERDGWVRVDDLPEEEREPALAGLQAARVALLGGKSEESLDALYPFRKAAVPERFAGADDAARWMNETYSSPERPFAADLHGFHPALLQPTVARFHHLARLFPEVTSRIQGVDTQPLERNLIATVSGARLNMDPLCDPAEPTIVHFSSYYARNPMLVAALGAEAELAGKHPAGSGHWLAMTVDHEFAHVMMKEIVERQQEDPMLAGTDLLEWLLQHPAPASVSTYADRSGDPYEWFVAGVVSWLNSPELERDPWVDGLIDVLEGIHPRHWGRPVITHEGMAR